MNAIHFRPGADLTFKSVIEVRSNLNKVLKNSTADQLSLDLSEVIHCDSAGLALLIEIRKLCRKTNKNFEIMGVPSQILSLADFCGVKDILETI